MWIVDYFMTGVTFIDYLVIIIETIGRRKCRVSRHLPGGTGEICKKGWYDGRDSN